MVIKHKMINAFGRRRMLKYVENGQMRAHEFWHVDDDLLRCLREGGRDDVAIEYRTGRVTALCPPTPQECASRPPRELSRELHDVSIMPAGLILRAMRRGRVFFSRAVFRYAYFDDKASMRIGEAARADIGRDFRPSFPLASPDD